MLIKDATQFLETCAQTETKRLEAFQLLLAALDDAKTRNEAQQFIEGLAVSFFEGDDEFAFLEKHGFSFSKLSMSENDDHHMLLLQLAHEDERTDLQFEVLQNLLELPSTAYTRKTLFEESCGTGMISILIANQFSMQKIVAHDSNPLAVTLARVNLYLNGLDDTGELGKDSEGRTLFEKVQFCETKDFKTEPADVLLGTISVATKRESLTRSFAEVLRKYHNIPASAKNILVVPSRKEFVAILLALFGKSTQVKLAAMSSIEEASNMIVECEKAKTRLFADVSQSLYNLQWNSLKFAADSAVPPHVTLFWELTEREFDGVFLYSENADILEALRNQAGKMPLLEEWVYEGAMAAFLERPKIGEKNSSDLRIPKNAEPLGGFVSISI